MEKRQIQSLRINQYFNCLFTLFDNKKKLPLPPEKEKFLMQ